MSNDPTALRERLEHLKARVEADRQHDCQWYRSMTVLHWINDVLDPPASTDWRSAVDALDRCSYSDPGGLVCGLTAGHAGAHQLVAESIEATPRLGTIDAVLYAADQVVSARGPDALDDAVFSLRKALRRLALVDNRLTITECSVPSNTAGAVQDHVYLRVDQTGDRNGETR